MSEQDYDDIRRLLQETVPRVDPELKRDLWPAMSRTLDARARRFAWFDWTLAGVASGVLVAFPDLLLVLLYHL
jgi:hypothetical protein